ncbi:FtsH protease activity modulator HflK [Granulosicoccus antarcticus]|uniref:Protein HflK n=1 Tax=Granulosicoccus antarcticus IMCC3135 TaxID=1192854 RepID=A0A2Z2P367_9GAMM|nr:FtsH protease activity modulator HflK [Granulosicoccus antarcticus]ASJ75077.1 Modulator of FtsH protease HflK [Granulosicoccus antarcticus IMCC3135]
MAWNEPGGNDNDPWGNRNKDSGGPPDLDEVFKNLKKWFGSVAGKKAGGNGPSRSGGGIPSGNIGGKGLGLIAGILGIVWLLSGIYVIQPAQAGVVTQFGAFVRTTTPGPHWRLPWPLQTVEKVEVEEIRSAKLTNQLILTQDENIVDIDLAVQYNINSAEDYLFNVRGPDRTLEEVVESALREVVGSTILESVLTTGRDVVWNTTLDSLQEVLDSYEAGIFITAVNLERAQPPEEVQDAFSDAIKAREDKERFVNEAQAYSNEVLPRARGDAQRALEQSEAYKARVEQAAIGESERFLSLLTEYSKAPEVTRERLYLEAMETVLSKTNKVLIDDDGGNSLMYLPIDQLMNQNRGTASDGGLDDSSPLNSGSNDSPRFSDLPQEANQPNRDDLRSRERGSVR